MKKTILLITLMIICVSIVNAVLGPELVACSVPRCTVAESNVAWFERNGGWFWDTDDGLSKQWSFFFNDKFYDAKQIINIKNDTTYNVTFGVSDLSIPPHSLKMELGGVNTTTVSNPSTFSNHSFLVTTINDNTTVHLWSLQGSPTPGSVVHIGLVSVKEVNFTPPKARCKLNGKGKALGKIKLC